MSEHPTPFLQSGAIYDRDPAPLSVGFDAAPPDIAYEPRLAGISSDQAALGVLGNSGTASAGLDGIDGELVARAISGDQSALREVWNRCRKWVAAVLIANMPKDAELDDLLQEVAVTVVSKARSVREPAAFKPWLRAVAISIAKTHARRRQVRRSGWFKLADRQSASAGELETCPGEASPHSASTLAIAEGRQLLELSRELPDGYREPLLLKCIQGMSYREIGRVMGLPETTVETRIARARRMLRDRATRAGMGEPALATPPPHTHPVPLASSFVHPAQQREDT